MVLAAGLGTRLWPLTVDRAKPALPFFGRPLILQVLEHLRREGVSRAVVNTHHMPDSVRGPIEGWSADGLEVAFSHETEILGTAGCLAKARDAGLLDPDKTTLVVNGKIHTNISLRAALDVHRRRGAKVTLILRENRYREAFREVLVEDGYVLGFGALNPTREPALMFTGMQWMEPEVLASLIPQFSDTVRDVFPALLKERSVAAHVDLDGFWWEFSTPERYLWIQQHLSRERGESSVIADPTALVAPDAEVTTSVLWENSRILPGATVKNAILCRDAVIHQRQYVENCIVIPRSSVGQLERGSEVGSQVHVPLALQDCLLPPMRGA
jgi:NDP-sugar pyrophosphorylase family protein